MSKYRYMSKPTVKDLDTARTAMSKCKYKRNYRCKLSDEDAIKIRKIYLLTGAPRGLISKLAAKYKVSVGTIHGICTGKTYKHLGLAQMRLKHNTQEIK